MAEKQRPEERQSEDRDVQLQPDDETGRRERKLSISGPGAADFLAAPGGIDRPESGSKGMAQTRGEGPLSDTSRLTPRQASDEERTAPQARHPEDDVSGSQTGTVGGGGAEAHNPSANRATGSDDETAGR